MNINTAFESRTLKASDMEDGDKVLTIADVKIETIGQGKEAENKPHVYFEETDKPLVLNKVNAGVIQKLYGADTDGWTGNKISLYATEVEYGGTMTMGIRIRLKPPAGKPSTVKSAPPAPSEAQAQAAGSKNPRTIAWMAFCDATPNYEQDKRSQAWADALQSEFPGKPEKTLTKEQWAGFAEQIRESYSEEIGGFIPV